MVQLRNTLVLYSTATCNLNCTYCFIDKNPSLQKIDNLLDTSYQGDYYINYIKNVFPDPNQLQTVQIWGGEPFLRMDRIYYTLEKIYENYPSCSEFIVSTNFVNSDFIKQFTGLMHVMKKANHKIRFILQLSLDGPSKYTDRGRGSGVTEKFIKRFDEFLSCLSTELPDNVYLRISFKPTLDIQSIRELQTKDEIINYYKFLEGFMEKLSTSNIPKDRVYMLDDLPNTACPSPFTKEDGHYFANFCKLCMEIEKDNIFKYYKRIRPFPKRPSVSYNVTSYDLPGYTCNTGRGMVGLLPNNMISNCHMSFVDLLGDYKKEVMEKKDRINSLDTEFFDLSIDTQLAHKFEDLENYERKIGMFYRVGSTARLTNMVNTIRLEAMVGNIKEKFTVESEAIKAAKLLSGCTSYCIRDNVNVTGSLSLYPVGLIRLFFNGAEEYLDYE